MEIVLFSAWMQFVSGQAAVHNFYISGLPPFVASVVDGKVITDPLRPGEWYGQLSQAEVLDRRTLEKRRFEVVVLPAFTVTEDDVRSGRKALSLDPLYALEIELPDESADQARNLNILTGKPFTMFMEIPSGSGRVLIVFPKGTFSLALFGSAPRRKIAERTFVLSGPERWERMSLGH
ncbi:MAG TPA: hypothetical protein VMN76_05330 [Acidobacteriota bacterium]|nr:hypothetical protein [Acidobacteriota bacterium]